MYGAEDRIRTYVGILPTVLQTVPFGHFGTSAWGMLLNTSITTLDLLLFEDFLQIPMVFVNRNEMFASAPIVVESKRSFRPLRFGTSAWGYYVTFILSTFLLFYFSTQEAGTHFKVLKIWVQTFRAVRNEYTPFTHSRSEYTSFGSKQNEYILLAH